MACTREEITGVTEEAEAHEDAGEAVEGEEAATTTMRELEKEEADRIRQHNESTDEYTTVLVRVRCYTRSLTAALHVLHAIIDVSLNRST